MLLSEQIQGTEIDYVRMCVFKDICILAPVGWYKNTQENASSESCACLYDAIIEQKQWISDTEIELNIMYLNIARLASLQSGQ